MFKRRSLYDHVYLKIQKCKKMQISNLGLLIPSGLGTGIRDGGEGKWGENKKELQILENFKGSKRRNVGRG